MSPRERFLLACNELGWGDPGGGVWFVAIEEASPWNAGDEARIERHYGHDQYFRGEAVEKATRDRDWTPEASRSQIDVIEAKICAPLSAALARDGIPTYRKMLWRDGSKVAHANIYPLGKPRITAWPAHYETLFGFSRTSQGYDEYLSEVRTHRFPRFSEARTLYVPQAIVCLGVTYWEDFRLALGLTGIGEVVEHDRICTYGESRVVLAPHWSYGGISDERAGLITSVLRGWNVRLP